MARYRVGDTYLSETEYAQHRIETWLAIVFWGGLLLGGIVAYWICPTDWPKAARFTLIIIVALGTGYLAILLNAEILWLFRVCLILVIGYQAMRFIWHLM